MKPTNPIIIGYPAMGEPNVIGTLADHSLPDDILIGATVLVNGKKFTFNISYVPSNPKRERLVPILQPKEKLDDSFWDHGATRVEVKTVPQKPKQEEWPF